MGIVQNDWVRVYCVSKCSHVSNLIWYCQPLDALPFSLELPQVLACWSLPSHPPYQLFPAMIGVGFFCSLSPSYPVPGVSCWAMCRRGLAPDPASCTHWHYPANPLQPQHEMDLKKNNNITINAYWLMVQKYAINRYYTTCTFTWDSLMYSMNIIQ